MKKFLTVVGARPQIIKAAALSRAIRTHFSAQVEEVIVHTGQHYDENMSGRFFEELQIPAPNHNLQVGSGKHGEQTAKMVVGIERILESEKPQFLILYGDTNSTLAGAIAAAKIHVPIVHIEAGLRSYNKKMPEEINRILTDHSSTYLFTPTATASANLAKEGFTLTNKPPYKIDNPGIFNVGDVMYDNSLYYSGVADRTINTEARFQIPKRDYVLVTLHRANNTDDEGRLNAIFEALQEISRLEATTLVLPLHPRTAKQIASLLKPALKEAVNNNKLIRMLPPVSFLEMIQLEKNARLVITDSGGVQKEAFFFGKPCLILRQETEWAEIVENRAAILCDADSHKILAGFHQMKSIELSRFPKLYGEGDAAEQMVKTLLATS